MYLAHFGLREAPFGITPDTSYFFACADYQEALNTLLVAIRSGEGFIKITGEVGTGKTLLCRQFLASINKEHGAVAVPDGEPQPAPVTQRFVTAYIPNPYLTPHTLLLALADELGVVLEPDVDQHHLLKSLTAALLDFARQDKQVVLCLDEAQAMPLESLEAIRLLTNLETEKRKLLQIVLFGQPELNQKLQQDSIRQLNQRITFHYHLGPLQRDDMDYYLSHRLNVAGFTGGRLFSRGAANQLYAASGGIPRLVNIVAHKALMLTYGEGRHQVSARHVRVAAMDTGSAKKSLLRWWIIAAALLLIAGSSALGWVVLR
ncbi:ExeA family protein [Sulfuriferula sp. GW1]|uniref:ExeA family protein n=1 Tax=Sulfuriferula sp. GW1 TaxID=3345111 RepID=UPI0039AF2276